MAADLAALCERVRNTDPRIMSLILADSNGMKLAHSYGPKYEEEYMKSAASVRDKAGLLAVLLMGIEHGMDDVFGKTEAVVKLHKKVSLVVFSTPSRKKVITMVTTRDADVRELIRKIAPVIKDF